MSEERGPLIACGCGCGQMLEQFDDKGRERVYVHGHFMRTLFESIRRTKAAAK